MAKKLWKYVEDDMWILTGRRVQLSLQDVLFGFQVIDGLSRDNVNMINHCILISKMCISKFKKNDMSIGTPISHIYELEKSIRFKEGLEPLQEQFWCFFFPFSSRSS